jgi:hypothetical protein
VGELSVLRIVADEVRRQGVCVLCLDAIAGRAGVSRSTAKNAIREARRAGLIEVKERRRKGWPSLTNIVRVIDPQWLMWLRHRTDRGGVKKLIPTDNCFYSKGAKGRKTDRCDTKHGLHEHSTQTPAGADWSRGRGNHQGAHLRA